VLIRSTAKHEFNQTKEYQADDVVGQCICSQQYLLYW